MTICTIIRDPKTKEVSKVLAPNGEESILFNSILDSFEQKDKEESLKAWAFAYTDTFKSIFGDWEVNDEKAIGKLDSNGEPLFEDYSNTIDQYVSNNVGKDTETSFDELLNDKETFGETIEVEPAEIETTVAPETIEPVSAQPTDQEINSRVTAFLESIGVSIQSVDVIRDANGNKLSANAKADMLNRIIEVVQGKEQIDTLPEEAAHFFVEMLGPGHPLYKEMFRKITDYKIYSSVVDKYKNLKSYRNMDGTINFDKLKKEAIGKLIAEHIIKLNHGDETNGRVAEALTWWQKLWKFITDVFNKSEVNPFEQSAQKILDIDVEGLELNPSEEEYYQYEDPVGSLRQDQNRITLDNSIDPRTGQKRHIYYYDGIQGKGSVTSVYVDKWLKSIFRSDERSEAQKLIDLAKADYGDIIHEQMQDIIKSWTNPDGTKKATQTPIKPKINPSLYNLLNRHIESLMNQYERNTVFFSEVKIFDQKTKIAGSIDLLVVQPDGIVDIYDWKSQEIYRGQDDLKPYKEDMYRIQLENYRKILQLQYGFKNFGKVRAVPIKTQFIYKNNSIYGLKTLEIGDIDPNLIPEDKNYLLPVTLKNESTGNEQLDELIKKLNGIYDKIKNTKYSKEEVYKKREELGKLRLVLRDLQLRNRIDRLVDLGLLEYKKYSDLLESKTLTGKDLMEGIKILDVFGESGVMLYELREEYYETIKEKGDKKAIAAYEEMNKKFLMMTSKVSKLIQDMKKYRDQQAKELGEKRGIMNLLDPEEPVGFFAGTFQALSNIKQKAFRVFSSILRKAQNDRDVRFQDSVDKLTSLKENFTKWASSKDLSTTAAMEMMLEVDDKGNWNGNFLDKYKPEFYQLRKKAIASGDALWVSKNMEYDEKAYKEAEKKQIEFFKSVLYSYDKKENDETIGKKIAEWKTRHQVIDANGEVNMDAILNSKNRFLRPNDEWLSDKWNKLIDPSNKPLKDVYDYFQSTLRYAENLGMLDGYSPKFIPSMYATKIESLSFGDVKGFSNPMRLFDDLQVDAGNQYSPQIDPTDGTIINRVPVYFTNDIGVKKEDGTMDYSKKSRDLFKVFAVWSKHMYNYEAMQSIEDASIMLVEAEKSKKSVVVDFIFGNPVIENGRIKTTDTNDPNAKLLSEFVNFYLYDQIGGRTKDTKFKIKGKEYSTLKSIQAAVSYFSLKTLGLNLISGTAQFVGGTGNALFQAQKGIVFTKKTWGRSMYLTASSKKAQAALRYLNILLEAAPDRFVDNLSLHLGDKVLNKNNAYFIQRQSDKAVQYPVAIAMMLEHMIDKETGNIVNIQDFVKKKYNYYTDFYNLPSDQREQIKAKIDKEVGELQEKESLLSVGVLDKDGNFSIPGIERTDEAYAAFRDKIKGVNKRILGNQSRDDINRIRTTLFGSALMQFRSWIPEMVEERTGQLKWDDELQTWSYGKFRVFFGDLFSKRMPRLLMSIITGFGDNAIELAKERYQVLQREAYERGEPFEISEGEFIDIYIANLRSMMSELLVVLAISGALFWALSGDDDDDKKGVKKYLARAIRKYYNEFMFYYSPIEFTRLLKNPVPAVGLAEDLYKITGQVLKEGYGRATGDEELTESAKPMKYLLRILPAGKEFLLTSAALDDDFRKEWDIRVDNVFY